MYKSAHVGFRAMQQFANLLDLENTAKRVFTLVNMI